MIDPSVAERLVRLRIFVVSALASISDTTAYGRHLAVIALDGACELAMGLAAHTRGIEVGQKPFPWVLRELRRELSDWTAHGAQGVSELHRARNAVQHEGVLPDPEHLPIWASEVERFVYSLIRSAFGEELDSVSTAMAVEDAGLRERLEKAERLIGDEDYAASIRGSAGAFDAALRSYRSYQGRSAFRFRGDAFRKLREFQDIKGTIEELEKFLDVAALAGDPGEWLWLETVRRQLHADAEPLSRDDAQRALSFVLGWTLRFESFAARYQGALKRARSGRAMAVYGERYETPRVIDIRKSERHPHERGQVAIDVTLNAIPPEWESAASEAFRRLQETNEVAAASWAVVRRNGLLEMNVPKDISPKDLSSLVEELIPVGDEVLQEWLERRHQQALGEAAVVERYGRALEDEARFGSIEAHYRDRTDDYWIHIKIDLPEEVVPSDVEQELVRLLEERGIEAERPHVYSREIAFLADEIPADDLAGLVAEALSASVDNERQRRDAAAKAEERLEGVLAEVRQDLVS